MRRLAIIPARGGSKRIPNKNIKNFLGKPMISYIVNTALDSKLFEKIHVSTDSLEIKKTAENYNLKVEFLRPQELSGDKIPIMPVLKFVVKKYQKLGEEFDQIWLLMACSPLVTSKDLISAKEIYQSYTPPKKLMSVSRFPAPIEWAFTKNKEGILESVKKDAFQIPSQEFKTSYYDTGNFCIFSNTEVLSAENAGEGENFIPFELSPLKSVDIDTKDDWGIAEKLYRLL